MLCCVALCVVDGLGMGRFHSIQRVRIIVSRLSHRPFDVVQATPITSLLLSEAPYLVRESQLILLQILNCCRASFTHRALFHHAALEVVELLVRCVKILGLLACMVSQRAVQVLQPVVCRLMVQFVLLHVLNELGAVSLVCLQGLRMIVVLRGRVAEVRLQAAEALLEVLELPVEQGVAHVPGRRRSEAPLKLVEPLAHTPGPALREQGFLLVQDNVHLGQRVRLLGNLDFQPAEQVLEGPQVFLVVRQLPLQAHELAGVDGRGGLALLLVAGHDVPQPLVVEADLSMGGRDLLLQRRHVLLEVAQVTLEGRGLLADVLELVLAKHGLLLLELGSGPLELRTPSRLVRINDEGDQPGSIPLRGECPRRR
mmetsp:Transcript_46712/g.123387  ORF Transcript_46712/g.123387 Transcript_46712/m.123387 type:complete len:369 (+) Transcript_46712:1128-2234(+)